MSRPQKYTEQKLIEIMKNTAIDGRLSKKDLDHNPNLPGAMTIIRRFGSWNGALRVADLISGKQTGRPSKYHIIGDKYFYYKQKCADDFIFFTKKEIYEYHQLFNYEEFTQKILNPFIDFLHKYIDYHGWIYPSKTSETDINNLMTKLQNGQYSSNSFVGIKEIKGMFNSMWSANIKRKLSPINIFNSDRDKYIKYLEYRFGFGPSKLYSYNFDKRVKCFELFDISFKQIRRGLEVNRCVVSLFKPALAKNICDEYGVIGGNVFDPCAGFGGRMIGAISAGMQYFGCEPNINTYKELISLKKYTNEDNQIFNIPLEDFHANMEFDLIFTCPPYFDKEFYIDNETQSIIKYDSLLNWQNNFLCDLLKCSMYLKSNSYFVVVVDEKNYSFIINNLKRYDLVLHDVRDIQNTKLHLNSNNVVEKIIIMRKQ